MRITHASIGRLVLAIALVVGPVAGTALARGPKSHGAAASSLELVLLDSNDGVAHWGQDVTFDVSTTETDYPVVGVQCHQADELVYSSSAGFYPEYPWQWTQTFVLESTAWDGGAADCTATLSYSDGRRTHELASLDFGVEA